MKERIVFPVGLLLENHRHLIIGPNEEGLRKAMIGLEAGCRVDVIGLDPVPGIVALARRKKIRYLRRPWRPSDIRPRYALIISCLPGDRDSRRISGLAARQRIPVNILDKPLLCSFYAPALFRSGSLTFAVFGGGLTPVLLKRIRTDLQKRYGHLAGVAAAVADLRRRLKLRVPLESDRRRIAQEIVDARFISKLARLKNRSRAIRAARTILDAKLLKISNPRV